MTITGLGGVGKSRLAQEVAGGVHESGGVLVLWSSERNPLLRTGGPGDLAVLIGDRPALLVLDGHEPDRVRLDDLAVLLRECRGLRVLATAPAPFGLPGERVFPLTPLAVPEPGTDDPVALAAVPSVRLLVREVRQVRPGFTLDRTTAADVAALCRRLDGIPAALEAAACWFLVYEPHGRAGARPDRPVRPDRGPPAGPPRHPRLGGPRPGRGRGVPPGPPHGPRRGLVGGRRGGPGRESRPRPTPASSAAWSSTA